MEETRLAARPPTRPESIRRQQHPVILDTKRRVLPKFKATPGHSIESILKESLLYVNARGAGCCAFHIVLATAAKVVKKLAAQSCDSAYSPFSTWQCQSCFAMNATAGGVEDGSDVDVLECDICGVPTESSGASDAWFDGEAAPDACGSRGVNRQSPSADGDRSSESETSSGSSGDSPDVCCSPGVDRQSPSADDDCSESETSELLSD